MKHNQDEIFKDIASRYAAHYGEELQREAMGDLPTLSTVGERRVKRAIRGIKLRRILPAAAAGLAAACLALVFALSALNPPAPRHDQVAAAPEPDAVFTAESAAYEIIPLAFSLPKNLSVADVDQDRARTIYYLEDEWQDDVVLVLVEADEAIRPEGARPLTINGETAYSLSRDGYQQLVFAENGIAYELTCRYDINTLIALSKNILVEV